MTYDFRHAVRSLRRRPAFALITICCIGVGIGAAAVALGLVDTVFRRMPPGVGDPQSVVRVIPDAAHAAGGGMVPRGVVSYPSFLNLQRTKFRGFTLAAYGNAFPSGDSLGIGSLDARLVSDSYFEVLKARPALGRFPRALDGANSNANDEIALGYDLWVRHFNRSRDVLGKTLRLNGTPFMIVGVAAEHFQGINGGQVDIWAPLNAAEHLSDFGSPLSSTSLSWIRMIARLDPGTSVAQARSELEAAARLAGSGPEVRQRYELNPLTPALLADRALSVDAAGDARRLTTAVSAIAIAMLLLMIVNVTLLLVVRNASRATEFAARAALGASRGAMVRVVVAESIVLSLLGGLVGLLASRGTGFVLRLLPGPVEQYYTSSVIVWSVVLVSAMTALAVAVYPVLCAQRIDIVTVLRQGAEGLLGTGGRLRGLLVSLQVCLAGIVVFSTLLFADGMHRADRTDIGLALDSMLVVSQLGHADVDQLQRRLESVPGVQGTSLVSGTPFHSQFGAQISGRAPFAAERLMQYRMVDTAYAMVTGLHVLAGRFFDGTDTSHPSDAIVINSLFATQLAGSPRAALGACLVLPPRTSCSTVIGVVADAKYDQLAEDPVPMYFRYVTGPRMFPNLLIRVKQMTPEVQQRITGIVRSVDAGSGPALTVTPGRQLIASQLDAVKRRAICFLLFGVAALATALAGLFGVQAYSTTLRYREVGIRMALGQPRLSVALLLGREAMVNVGVGLAVAVAASLAIYPTLSDFVFRPQDVRPGVILAATALVFVVAAGLTVMHPVWRITRQLPLHILRMD